MEYYTGYIQLALILLALTIAFSTIKGRNKSPVIASIFAGVVMLLHFSIELLNLSEFLYSITGLLYTVTIIVVVLMLRKKETSAK